MKKHKFWAWAAIICMAMSVYTGYKHKVREGGLGCMLDRLKKIDTKKTGIFAAGVLFGTAGIRLLSGGDAKKVYTYCTAAVLRAKECIMDTVSRIQENAEDIYAEAVQMNEERAAGETEFEDWGSLKEERGNGEEEEV